MEEIARLLNEKRRELGMSVDELAEKSGIPRSTVGKVLTNHSPNPTLETIKAITYALGLRLDDLDRASNTVKQADVIADQWRLTDNEKRLVIAYRQADDAIRAVFDSTVDVVVGRDEKGQEVNPA